MDNMELPRSTRGRDGNSGSSSRSRSPNHQSRSSRHRRHRRSRSRFRFKHKERNFLAAVCSTIVIVTLCTAMAEPNWFHLQGGGCRDHTRTVHTLGVFQFFYLGHFSSDHESGVKPTQTPETVYHFSSNPSDVLINCVTPYVVQIMRSIIAMCFIGVILSLLGFFLDLSGPGTKTLKFLRRNAVFSILTVVVCVTINGFAFLVTQLVENLQSLTKVHHGAKVIIRFDVSFYLVAAAGGVSVIGAACNLLKNYPVHESSSTSSSDQAAGLLEDYDGMDVGAHPPESLSPIAGMPPPPPYAP